MATAFQSFSISLDQGSQKYHFKPFIGCAKKETPQRSNRRIRQSKDRVFALSMMLI